MITLAECLSNSASRMYSPLPFDVFFIGKFWCSEYPDMLFFTGYFNSCLPSAPMRCYPKKSRFAVLRGTPLILRINTTRHIPKVIDTIVVNDSVYVVYVTYRPRSMDVKPCKPIGVVRPVTDLYGPTPRSHDASGYQSLCLVVVGCFPREYSSGRFVVQNFAQTFCGKIGLSHAVVPYKQWFGQRPRRVCCTAGLRHFNSLIHRGKDELSGLDSCRPGLPINVLAAFSDAAYNIGPHIACDGTRSTAARLLAAGKYRDACEQLPRWNKAKVGGLLVPLPGLTKRREAARKVCLGERME